MATNPVLPVVAPNDLITSVHMNNVRANIDRLDTSKLSLTGGTVTGTTSLAGPTRIARPGFVRPFLEFYSSESFATRQAAIIGADTGLELTSDGPVVSLWTGGAERARVDASNMLIGKTASAVGTAGVEIALPGRMTLTMATASVNQICNHIGAADANAVAFAQFQRAGTLIGSITQVATTGVAFNTTSDERLKDVVGPVADPLERVLALRPVRFAWKDNGAEQDGFLAHEVQAVVPEAVTGERGAVNPDGSIDPQQLDASKLIPILVAAVQALTARVAELEAAA